METKVCKVFIDDKPFEFKVEGDFFWGKPEVLFKPQDNVISKTDWYSEGYSVVEAFSKLEFSLLRKSITKNIVLAIKKAGIEVDETKFSLEKYHDVVLSNQDHYNVINYTRNLTNDDFDFDVELLAQRFGEELGYKLTTWIAELKKSHIQIRISRPNSLDINPPHRDGYLSYWENIINIWVPICGCSEKTSLPVVPKSHLISEDKILRTSSKGAKINGNLYFVPCILETNEGPFKMYRPNPKEGQALIFSPFLIHGSAVNQSNDTTRISLELRMPKIN